MIRAMLSALVACRHRRLTRPITPVHRPGTPAQESYVSCLDCGQRFAYDVENLRIAPPRTATRPAVGRQFASGSRA